MVSLSFSIWKCYGHIEMWVEEASKSEGRAVGHVTCTELVADRAFDLIKAEKLAFLLSKSKSRSNRSGLCPGTVVPYRTAGERAVAFMVVLQDSNVLRPRSERACRRTTAVPFLSLFIAFTYNKKEPPVFGAAPAFWCILLSFLGLPFRHIPNNLSNDNELTANAPFFYQISGTWSNHEGKRTHPLLHLARDDKERASSIDEQRIDRALGIALFFSPFLSASSNPFVRNFFVSTESLAESNPIPQDPISAIHPPCIYARAVASAMGFGLCRSKMMNGIVALYSPPIRKDDAKKNGRLFRSAGCVGSRRTNKLFTLKFKHVGAKGYPALLLRSNRSLLMLLRRRFAFSSLWTRALVDIGME
nr:cytochrome c biogenesis FN1, mitochondrial [Tanacetum cinerariifolium]